MNYTYSKLSLQELSGTSMSIRKAIIFLNINEQVIFLALFYESDIPTRPTNCYLWQLYNNCSNHQTFVRDKVCTIIIRIEISIAAFLMTYNDKDI